MPDYRAIFPLDVALEGQFEFHSATDVAAGYYAVAIGRQLGRAVRSLWRAELCERAHYGLAYRCIAGPRKPPEPGVAVSYTHLPAFLRRWRATPLPLNA